MKIVALVFTMIFSSCQHPIKKTDSQVLSEFLFLEGTYKQKIEVRYVKDGKTEENSFNAVLKYSASEISMYCYVGFGYTLFKLKDNLKDAPQFEAGDPRIEKNKDFFLRMYPLIKEALLARKKDPRWKNNEMTLSIQPDNFPVRIEVSEDAIKGVPRSLIFENKDHFRFLVTNTDFEPQ